MLSPCLYICIDDMENDAPNYTSVMCTIPFAMINSNGLSRDKYMYISFFENIQKYHSND